MLLIVIAALGMTLVIQQRRSAIREAEFRARLTAAQFSINMYKIELEAERQIQDAEAAEQQPK
jgi:hypothetical protein